MKGRAVLRKDVSPTTRPIQVVGPDVACWSHLKGVGVHGDLPVGGERPSRQARVLLGDHLHAIGPDEPRACWNRLRLGQGIVQRDRATGGVRLLVTYSSGGNHLFLAERERG